jgi:hypothetical protein
VTKHLFFIRTDRRKDHDRGAWWNPENGKFTDDVFIGLRGKLGLGAAIRISVRKHPHQKRLQFKTKDI